MYKFVFITDFQANRTHHNNMLCGLCGNLNGLPSDDHWPQYGMGHASSIKEFVDSWKTDGDCGIKVIHGQSDKNANTSAEEDEVDDK